MNIKYFQKITSIKLKFQSKEEEVNQENEYIFKVFVDKENIIIISSKGLILIYNKINFSLKLSKNIIPEGYSSNYLNILKLENDLFLIIFGSIIIFFKILLPEIITIRYGYYFLDDIIHLKNDIFVCVNGTSSFDLPDLKLIEFYIEKEKKDKSLKEYFEEEEINYSILDSFYVIKQEYDFSHEESYEFPSNILYLKDNEIVAFYKKSYYSNLLFIKINNNKFFEKKDIKSTNLGIIDNRIIFLFFIKEKNYLLCGCEKGLFNR